MPDNFYAVTLFSLKADSDQKSFDCTLQIARYFKGWDVVMKNGIVKDEGRFGVARTTCCPGCAQRTGGHREGAHIAGDLLFLDRSFGRGTRTTS